MSDGSRERILAAFASYLDKHLGIHFESDKYEEIFLVLKRNIPDKDESAAIDYMQKVVGSLGNNNKFLPELANWFSINETYFFRHGCGFEELQEHLLPELIEKRRSEKTLRIWSSGCSIGCEPLSLVILIQEKFPEIHDWNLDILATDIDEENLKKARKGIFREWAFRNINERYKSKYFTQIGEKEYQIDREITDRVSFFYLNLIDESYPLLENGTNALDIILCNNTLIYFSQESIKSVIDKFSRCLLPEGYLIVTASEASYINHPHLNAHGSGCQIFTKEGAQKKAERPPPLQQSPMVAIPVTQTRDYFALFDRGEYELCLGLQEEERELTQEEQILLIRSLANLGKLKEAKSVCKNYLQVDDLSPLLHFLLASIHQELDEVDEAIVEFKRAIFLSPDFIMAHFSLAFIFYTQKNPQKAQIHQKAVLEELKKYEPEDFVPKSDCIKAGH
ncbi:MAG: hypothetical protein MRY21_00260 [Simkaniaceae bacterium]|nr:hypothetical protein [Simkaniaceae bacterium]